MVNINDIHLQKNRQSTYLYIIINCLDYFIGNTNY